MKPVLPIEAKQDHILLGFLLCMVGVVWILTAVLIAHGIPLFMASLAVLGSVLCPIGLYWCYREREL